MLTLPSLGRHWPWPAAPISPDAAWLAAALAPFLLVAGSRPLKTVVWLVVAAAAVTGGSLSAGAPRSRPAVVAPEPMAPSRWNRWSGGAALRLTARARPGREDRWSAPARLLAWRGAENGVGTPPRPGDGILVRGRGAAPAAGTVLGGSVRLRPPRSPGIPGGFDESGWLSGRDLDWVATTARGDTLSAAPARGPAARVGAALARTQRRLRRTLAGGLPPREAALASAVLLGGGADRSLREPFLQLGLAHLFALSGLHVGIIGGMILLAARPLGGAPARTLSVLAPSLAAYAVLVDLPGSVVRAVGLVLLGLAARASARAPDALRLLGLLLWVNVLWRPAGVLDAGLRLSYLAAGGIVAGQGLLQPVARPLGESGRRLIAALGVTIAAQLATLPVVADSFGQLPPAAPLFNLLVVPVFGFAALLLAGGLAVSTVWTWAGHGLLAAAWFVLRPVQAAASVADGWAPAAAVGLPVWGPGRSLLYATVIAALVGALRAPSRVRAAVPLLYVLALAAGSVRAPTARPGGAPTVWQFDVGQGDCAWFSFPDGWSCLIDTGPPGRGGAGVLERDIRPFLRRERIAGLDLAVLTHDHDDHTGGAADLAAALEVGAWLAGGRAEAPVDAAMPRPLPGDTLHAAGDWALVLLGPDPAAPRPDGENDASISVGLCRHGILRGLWTGDLETAGESALVPRLPPVPASGIDVWKAGHHGSRTSGTPALLEAIRPRLVLVSCGVANRHRHPSHDRYPGARTLRTDLSGSIRVDWPGDGTCRARAVRAAPPRPP